MLVSWKRIQAGEYEAVNHEGQKFCISKGEVGWSVYDNEEGWGICGEYLFTANTLKSAKFDISELVPFGKWADVWAARMEG